MVKPFSQVVQDKLDTARVKTQERLFKDFVACKSDYERREVGAKMDCLSDVVNMLKKELKELTD